MARERTRKPARVSNPNKVEGHGKARESLTAAGDRIGRREADRIRRLAQPWQDRSFAYYDLVPEIKYAAQFYSRLLSPLRLYVAKKDEKGEWQEVEDQSDAGVMLLERVQDPGGGRSGLLGSYGRLRFLTGEAQLFVSKDRDTEDEQWEMLSHREVRPVEGGGKSQKYERRRAPSLNTEVYREPADDEYDVVDDQDAIAYRLWNRHPLWSQLADSTMQGVLDVCEELVLLTQTIRARCRSRLAGQGILIINGNVVPIPVEGDAADENPDEDPFLRDLTDAMTTPIADEGAASSVVPMVVRVDVDKELGIDNVMKHIQINDPTQLYPETGMRIEAVERLGVGLDLPPEELKGMADANHWTGWVIDEQKWKMHGQPVAQQLMDDLNASFFRPSLRAANVESWRDYAIMYDPAAVINHPDRTKDAKDLHKANAIGDEALRDAAGFDDDDAPTEEERRRFLAISLRDPSILTGQPSRAEPAGTGGDEPLPDDTIDGGDASAETKKEPPAEEPPPEPSSGGNVTAAVLASRVLGAADLALLRARECAGNRLRNYAKRDPETLKLLDGVQVGKIASALGRERVRALRAPSERDLVAGARDLIAESLRLYRIDRKLAERLGEKIEQHAALTLYEEQPARLPASFANYVREAVGARE